MADPNACVRTSGPFLDSAIGAGFIVLCCVVAAQAIAIFVYSVVLDKLQLPFRRNSLMILVSVLVFCIFRITAVGLLMGNIHNTAAHVIDRINWVIFLFFLSLILYSYFKNFHIRYMPPTERLLLILKFIFMGSFAIMCIVQFGTLIAFLTNQSMENIHAFNAVVLVFTSWFIFLTLLFFLYSVFLLWKIKKQKQDETERNVLIVDDQYLRKQKKAVLKIFFVMLILTVLFVIRLAVFAVQFQTFCVTDQMFFTFGYILPEIVPMMVFMFLITSTKQSQAKPSASTVIAAMDNTVATLDRPLLDEINSLGSFREPEGSNSSTIEPLPRMSAVQEAHNSYTVDDFDDGTGTYKLNYSDIEEEENQFLDDDD